MASLFGKKRVMVPENGFIFWKQELWLVPDIGITF
jgi:hypothetical protein